MYRTSMLVAVSALLVACGAESKDPTSVFTVPVLSLAPSGAADARSTHFGTPLSAEEEVMPAGVVNTSNAVGNTVFSLSADGTELHYKLIVANIENVFMAHLHRAAKGVNGGVIVWLYPSTAVGPGPVGGGRVQGAIAEGTIRAENLVGSLAGQPLSALLALLSSGDVYVNVHTNDGIAPTNSGPGDYPGGEVRGQVDHRGR
jgi:CHRD domain